MGDPSALLWGLLFGAIGAGYFVYGKRQQEGLPLLCGLGLIVLPWIFTGSWTLALAGGVLVALPWVWRD